MLKTGQFTNSVNKALIYLVKIKDAARHLGQHQATILSLKALIARPAARKQKGKATFTITVNGKEAAKGEVTEENADVMQLFDLKELRAGRRQRGDHRGEGRDEPDVPDRRPALRAVGRRSRRPSRCWRWPWTTTARKLSTADLLQGEGDAEVQRQGADVHGDLDLGIPPGFTVDAGRLRRDGGGEEGAEVQRDGAAGDLYLGDVKPGEVQTFEYTLKPKYPIKAKTPATVAYEYYTPANRATAAPVELVVEDAKK